MPWGIIVTFRGQCATWARVAFVAGGGRSGLAAQSSPPIQFTDVTPKAHPGSPDLLYHNDGNGSFTHCDAGGENLPTRRQKSFGGSGRLRQRRLPDIFVAKDGLYAYLYHNEH